MYSEKLEELISLALQDGNLTEQKRNLIMRRAEKEGEDVEEVMMVVEARLQKNEAKGLFSSDSLNAITSNLQYANDFIETVNGVSFKMINVEGGPFMMFSQEEPKSAFYHAKPQKVFLDNYYICNTLVTQKLWNVVMGASFPFYFVGENLPVNNASWNDCQSFIDKLNSITGKEYHFPSEAQWEYACVGGKKTLGYKYAGSDDINKVAWHSGNSQTYTIRDMLDLYNSNHFFKVKELNDDVFDYFFKKYKRDYNEMRPVASLKPNELGLYDMCGNAYEYCLDDYDSEPSFCDNRNPVYHDSQSCEKVFRSFSYENMGCPIGYRMGYLTTIRDKNYSFRLAL